MQKQHNYNLPDKIGYYISGFVDGEGSFITSARKRSADDGYPCGWKFSFAFNISNNDLRVLRFCQHYLGFGNIRETGPGKYILEIEDAIILRQHIIPFFKKYPFVSVKKRHSLRVFELLLKFVEQGPIQTGERLLKYFEYRRVLGKFRESRITNTDKVIVKTFICQRTLTTVELPNTQERLKRRKPNPAPDVAIAESTKVEINEDNDPGGEKLA